MSERIVYCTDCHYSKNGTTSCFRHMDYAFPKIDLSKGAEFSGNGHIHYLKYQKKMDFTLQDIVDAVQYGFDYRVESQNDGKKVPTGNVLQWLMAKKDLIDVPTEFKEYQEKERAKL